MSVFLFISGICGDKCLPTSDDLFSFGTNGILPNLLFLALQGVAYFGVILLLENPQIKNRTRLAALKSKLQVNLQVSHFDGLQVCKYLHPFTHILNHYGTLGLCYFDDRCIKEIFFSRKHVVKSIQRKVFL